MAIRIMRSKQMRMRAVSSAAAARSATWPRKIEPIALPTMKASRGLLAADGEMLKKCATIGIPQTPDSVVTTAKCDANVMAHPQFATCESDCRLAARTPPRVLVLRDAGSGLSASEARARLATPTHAIKTKHARQPKPVTAEASGVVAITPPT